MCCFALRDEGGFLKIADTCYFAARDEQTHMSRVCGDREQRFHCAVREERGHKKARAVTEAAAFLTVAENAKDVHFTNTAGIYFTNA